MRTRVLLAATAAGVMLATLATPAHAAVDDRARHCSDQWCRATPAELAVEAEKEPYVCAVHPDHAPVKAVDGTARGFDAATCNTVPYISQTTTWQLYQSHNGGPFYRAGRQVTSTQRATWLWGGAIATCVPGVTRQWKLYMTVNGKWFPGSNGWTDTGWSATSTLNC